MGFFPTSTFTADTARPRITIPECGKCGLYRQCQSPKMEPTGRGKHKILFVGEAPGETEDIEGQQFVGKAGQWLRGMLNGLGVSLDDCHLTNSVICRPPRNEIDDLHIDCCRPNLLNTIRKLKPSVIVLLGGSAVKSLISTEWGGDLKEITRWVGWQIPSQLYGAWLCPTYHPSYVLREGSNPALVKIVQGHLKRALALEGVPVPQFSLLRAREAVEVLNTPREGRRRMGQLAGKAGRLAFDYETTTLKPEGAKAKIICASFCYEGKETFATPIDESCYPELSAVLKNDKLLKTGSNIKFEERWSLQVLGHGVAGWEWDDMLGSHVLDNRRGITSIKFQSYVHLGIGDYSSGIKDLMEGDDDSANSKNRLHKEPHDVMVYCGLDSLLEYKVGEIQRKALYGQKKHSTV